MEILLLLCDFWQQMLCLMLIIIGHLREAALLYEDAIVDVMITEDKWPWDKIVVMLGSQQWQDVA